jgi:hypothetical protein
MCSNLIVPTNRESEFSVASSIFHVNISIYACGIGSFQRSLCPIVMSFSYTRVELIISSHAVLHVFFVEYCKDSSWYRGTECISSWRSVCPSTYAWVYVVQPSSVVTHVRVRTGDRKPWSVNASVLMLSCRYASFYIYLLSIYCLDASSIVWLNTLIGVRVRFWPCLP